MLAQSNVEITPQYKVIWFYSQKSSHYKATKLEISMWITSSYPKACTPVSLAFLTSADLIASMYGV